VVVVVSAPGDMTDDLITLAEGITDTPDEKRNGYVLPQGEQASIALMARLLKLLKVNQFR